jgi:ferric-dicitrate binding protein FerR (iron transport regulator)
LLNAASSIKYPANFKRDSIVVELKGEAYFEVKRDSIHPFIVDIKRDRNVARIDKNKNDTAPGAFQLKVSRGQFNLKAYTNEPFITATMLKGNATSSRMERIG